MSILETIVEARRRGDFEILTEAIPYARYLGLTAAVTDGRLITSLAYNPRNLGNPELPALHGGVVGAFLELAATFELLWNLECMTIPKTVNLSVDYLRPAGPVTSHAHGTITRFGRRVVNVRVAAWQDDENRPIAQGHAHFLVVSTD